jgi:hypothetical protein
VVNFDEGKLINKNKINNKKNQIKCYFLGEGTKVNQEISRDLDIKQCIKNIDD